ncbi:SRPBCC family protein [Halalkalicoccus sp. NIPERK01]|uniref:SRPBCC family protein n=1 Tax=Halalkalicoccus sp. NIPERK01 TaxID=3053469 RepID=UPI00256F5083|nr:SRPBCC family protein [Halalkalicoccus sp. NIPERK01]MDL5362998.1 SRPBCC family protein [Halalkalicoccus sp. NIPERK01]
MREVSVSRFVRATTRGVERVLSPAALVEYEGSFEPHETVELEDRTRVIAGASGLEMGLLFEDLENGYRYEQEGEAGPFERMETTITYEPENEGTRIRMRSSVTLDLFPRPLTDRVAAWKREAELERALDAIEAALA